MKYKDFEGSPQEFNDVIQNNGLNASELFDIPKPPVAIPWIIFSVVILVASLGTMIFIDDMSVSMKKANLIITLGCAAFCATMTHLRVKNITVTAIIGISCLVMALMAFGTLSPTEIAEYMKNYKK